jgi:quercetin dioxygenase-like cupin family protein
MKRAILWTVAAMGAVLLAQSQKDNPNFTGGEVMRLEVPKDATMVRFRFEPGARTKWHTHSVSQVITVEEGVALHQVKGGPVVLVKAGQTIAVGAGVLHWHGAAPDKGGTQFNITRGDPQWGETVSDAEYRAKPVELKLP